MSQKSRIRVLLADDHRIFLDSLRLLLASECDIVGTARDGETAVALAVETRPDLVLLDIGMPGIGGLNAARRISRQVPGAKVLILSEHDEEKCVIEAFTQAHAAGYVLKTEDAAPELLSAVRAVHEGRQYLSSSVAPIVIARLNNTRANRQTDDEKLTQREREILCLVAEGATTKEIAARLGISPKTAQVHRDNLKQKLALRTTAAMVRYAVRHKLVWGD